LSDEGLAFAAGSAPSCTRCTMILSEETSRTAFCRLAGAVLSSAGLRPAGSATQCSATRRTALSSSPAARLRPMAGRFQRRSTRSDV